MKGYAYLEVAAAHGRVEVIKDERLRSNVEHERKSLSVRLLAVTPSVDRQRRQVDACRHEDVGEEDWFEEVDDDVTSLSRCHALDN